MKQPFRLGDYYALKFPGQPAVSPDGSRVAFAVQGYRKKENDRCQNLWLTSTDGSGCPHRLTRGQTSDTAPAWSPDGRYLAFLSTRPHELEIAALLAAEKEKEGKKAAGGDAGQEDAGEGGGDGAGESGGQSGGGGGGDDGADDDKPRPQIWVLDMELGGEPRQLTWREEGVESFDWSPDGRALVFASRDPTKEQKEYLKSIRGKGKTKDRGPLVIDRVQHKFDPLGYLDSVRTHLFTVGFEDRRVSRLTDGPCDENSPRWSPHGDWIVFVSNRTGDPDSNLRHDLWLIRPDGSETRRLTFGDVDAAGPRWSPDGRRVAFSSSKEPENGYVLRHLMCVEVSRAEPVADLTRCVGDGWSDIGGVVPDDPGDDPVENARVYPAAERSTPVRILTEGLDRPVLYEPPVWVGSGEMIALAGDRGQTRLVMASLANGSLFVFPAVDRMCTLTAAHASGGTVVVGLERPQEGPALFALPVAGLDTLPPVDGRALCLTSFNDELFARRATAVYERILFENSDGDKVEALVAFPPGLDPASARRLPVLVNIHGGPMWYDSPGFEFDVQYWAGRGYLVLMVNYRGSISYGEEFCRVIRGGWGPRRSPTARSSAGSSAAGGARVSTTT